MGEIEETKTGKEHLFFLACQDAKLSTSEFLSVMEGKYAFKVSLDSLESWCSDSPDHIGEDVLHKCTPATIPIRMEIDGLHLYPAPHHGP